MQNKIVRLGILAKQGLRRTRQPPNGPIVFRHHERVPMVIFAGEAIGFGEEEGLAAVGDASRRYGYSSTNGRENIK